MKNQKSNYVTPKVVVAYFQDYCICGVSAYDVVEADFFMGNPFGE